jgi:hypothetical protein
MGRHSTTVSNKKKKIPECENTKLGCVLKRIMQELTRTEMYVDPLHNKIFCFIMTYMGCVIQIYIMKCQGHYNTQGFDNHLYVQYT